ncbi:3-ketoacyl-CoA synthase 11 [Apostasia shenzhenica]|uniref:3-ketoacyl-CoA synthase n=1 Tax=Apostasia shenzhenica TaxID=1088818 RepID=A0A2I0B0H9_9ASPA|nr:3-ketoacyl-CoA synthase 11 [Apostasia shenzhenica]
MQLMADKLISLLPLPEHHPLAAVLLVLLLSLLAALHVSRRRRPVYLVEFSCYRPADRYKVTRELFMKQFKSRGTFTPESVGFQRRMLERSGVGQATYLPASLLESPIEMSSAAALNEARMVVFGAVDELLAATAVRAKDVAVVVVNCSLYNPTPSLAAMVINRYKLRGNVVSYSLAGMGCSAGLIAVDLAKRLLQIHRESYALVVSTENMTLNAYFGNDRSMLLTNSLFRMGAAAVLLSNRRSDRRRSKYQLLHTVRTHTGAAGRSYSCISQEEDAAGLVGVSLSKDLMAVAGAALRANITSLGPLILPVSEQLRFLASFLYGRVLRRKSSAGRPYVPDFRRAVDHFCIHAGGRAVLDELERSLRLTEWHMEPSRMTLFRFGNTSSSSLWYELAYAEAKGRMKKGDRVWQIAFGSGFKCNSAVWRALRTVDSRSDCAGGKRNPWGKEIDDFPVEVPKEVSVEI